MTNAPLTQTRYCIRQVSPIGGRLRESEMNMRKRQMEHSCTTAIACTLKGII